MSTTGHLASIRIITADIHRLVGFYAQASGVEPAWLTDDFAELRWPAFTLAIGSTRTLAFFGDDVAQAAANRSVIVELQVSDVDAEHARLCAADPALDVVQPPTTMPWGNRSALLRDPDGNLVNLFTPPVDGRRSIR